MNSDAIAGDNLSEILAGSQPGWCEPLTAGCNNQLTMPTAQMQALAFLLLRSFLMLETLWFRSQIFRSHRHRWTLVRVDWR